MPSPTVHRPHNALSNSVSGDCYTGLGCFPLGHHTTHTEISDLIPTLRRLREHKMLKLIPHSTFETIKKQLEPLQAAQSFWAHHSRDAQQAHAVQELLDGLAKQDGRLKIYIFADSERLSSAAPQVWGLFELDIHTRSTILYISGKQRDLAGTVLHTFMSSRRCARVQCFLAEYVLADQAGRLSEEWELPERFQWDIEMLEVEELKELLERLESESCLEAPVLMAKLRVYCEEMLDKKKEPMWWGGEDGWL